jgi:hypothetical protein
LISLSKALFCNNQSELKMKPTNDVELNLIDDRCFHMYLFQ